MPAGEYINWYLSRELVPIVTQVLGETLGEKAELVRALASSYISYFEAEKLRRQRERLS